MTPRQARAALGGFFLLAAGVTGNALYLQEAISLNSAVSKATLAPRRETPPRPPAEQPKSAALLKPQPASAETAAEAPPDEADTRAVRAIQQELNRRRHGPLAVDGVVRPTMRAAIMAFEHEHNLPLTGEATQALLKRLVLGPPTAPEIAGTPEVKSPHARAVIRQVQQLLAARGYRPGAVDGRLSGETVAAIRAFERDQRLAPTGRISADILVRLQDDAPGAKALKER
jgi:peptidoglycan hydrolase-like protein with peptidoglycan-binding domain